MVETYPSFVPLYAVLVSLGAALLVMLSGRFPNLREFWTIAAAFVKCALVLTLLPGALEGAVAEVHLVEISPGVALSLRADPLGVFFAIVASSLWVLTSFYSIGYVRGLREHKQTRYFASFAVCLSATIGVAFAANLLTFVIFYEILTIATYPLVVHKETREAISGGRKYLAYTLSAGLILIAATAWTYGIAGTLDFKAGGLLRGMQIDESTLRALFMLLIMGVGVKAAVMPLHSWLPTAMVAPTPVSALLHAVAVVKSGVFGVLRVTGFVFGPDVMTQAGLGNTLAVFAGGTIILASLLAFSEDNLKRRLAFSTVGHLSYSVLGAALLTPSSYMGGLLHLASHATMKITLFFCAGAIYVHTHKENVSELDGVARSMPWTMGAFMITSIGLIGIPPLNGFISKWHIGFGAVEGGHYLSLAVLLVSGLLNAGYLFPIIHRAYFRKGNTSEKRGDAHPLLVVPLIISGGVSLLLGIVPNAFIHMYDLARSVSRSVLGAFLL